jgi:hypothetical protein
MATMDPASQLVALVERVQTRYERSGLASLNDAERTLLVLYILDNEVCNGGFGQWLFHAPRDLIAISAECLQRIGEAQVLQLVRSILDELSPEALQLDWEGWQDYLEQMPEAFWQRIGGHDLACGSLERGMIERLWSYTETVAGDIRLA